MQKLFLFILAVLAVYTSAIAQDCNFTIKGNISDFHDRTPIANATILVLNSNRFTTSDKKGNFELKNVCGKITLEIRHIACETKQLKITVDRDIEKKFFLEHHLEELSEVIVKGDTKTEKTSIEKSITQSVLENFSDKSLGDALNTLSGVSSLNTGNSIVKPMIHGLHSSRLLIVNNNVRLFDQEWGDEHAPNIDINASGRISVIKGANTLKYGSDAIGGLITILPEKFQRNDSIFGSTLSSFNSNGRGGLINSEIVKTYKSGFYAKLQANVKRFGDFSAPNYNLTNTGLQSVNTSLSLGNNKYEKGYNVYYSFVHNKFGILRASHIGNVNDLVAAINSDQPAVQDAFSYDINFPRQLITHHLGKIDAYKRIQGLGKLSVQYDFQLNRRKEFDLRRGDRSNIPVIDLRLFTNSLQSDLEITKFENVKLTTGVLLRYQQNDAVAGTGVSPLIPDFDRYEIGAYTIGNYRLDDDSELSAGLRYDFSRINATKRYNRTDWITKYNYNVLFPEFESGSSTATSILTNPRFTFHNLSASLGYSRKFKNDYELFVNYGLASRNPNPSELFSDGLHHSAARIEIGNLTIGKEIANKFGISIEKQSDQFGFTISPYYKHIDGFIQLIPTGITTTIRGAFPVWEYTQVNARIFGLDIDVNKKISHHLNYIGNLSLLQGDNLTDNVPLINMPAANVTNKLSYTHANFHQLTLSVVHRTVFQQERFPDYNFTTFNPVTQQNIFVDISSTPPTYSLFGFQSSAVFTAFKKNDLKIEFNIDNLFNVSYREHLNRFRFFADELGRNMNLKIKINY